jgi:hypothetical protein
MEAAPGNTNIPLTLTIGYTGSVKATTVNATLFLAAAQLSGLVVGGFTDVFGATTPTASTFSVSPDTSFTFTYYLDIANTTEVGVYSIPVQFEWTTPSVSSGYFVESSTLTVSMLGTPDLTFSVSPTALKPGEVNNVTLAISNVGSGVASQVVATVTATATGLSVLNPIVKVQDLRPGESTSRVIGFYLPASLSGVTAEVTGGLSGSAVSLSIGASYVDSYGSRESISQVLGLYVLEASTPLLSFQAESVTLYAGENNTVPIMLTNSGSGPALQIRTQISSSSQSSVLNQFPLVADLEPESSVSADIVLYVPQGLSGSPLTLSFTSAYTDEFGESGTYTQSLGLYIANSTSSLPSVLVSVSPVKSDASVGTESEISFDVEDVGPASLYSPVLSLTVSSPLVVIQNSSYALPSGVLTAGKSVVYDAIVGSSTSATPGYYAASVTVTYVNKVGTIQSAAFSSGVVLSGMIDLVIQSPQVTQANNTVSVTGEILNEGFSSAYYATVTGSIMGLKGSTQGDYVGEVDPNTPVPFSITITTAPLSSTRNANVSIDVSFKDSLGIVGGYSSSVPATLQSASSLLISSSSSSSASGTNLLTYLEVGVIAVLVVMVVVGSIYIRRSRAGGTSREHKEKDDQGVI